jgi:hypothetical protein
MLPLIEPRKSWECRRNIGHSGHRGALRDEPFLPSVIFEPNPGIIANRSDIARVGIDFSF